jgi:23S rRNA-intervening sequence protein
MNNILGSKNGARTRHYRDLLVWQKAMELARAVYRDTEALPKAELFGLQSQMRRAAVPSQATSQKVTAGSMMGISGSFWLIPAARFLNCRHNWNSLEI